jgi:hypothetical protein
LLEAPLQGIDELVALGLDLVFNIKDFLALATLERPDFFLKGFLLVDPFRESRATLGVLEVELETSVNGCYRESFRKDFRTTV